MLGRQPPRDHQIWKLAAFNARYAHQTLGELLTFPITDLLAFNAEVAAIIEQETEAVRRRTDNDY